MVTINLPLFRFLTMPLIHPSYFRIYEKDGDRWFLHKGRKFYSQSNCSLNRGALENRYGLSIKDIIARFFLVGRGRSGFYLADLKHQQFHFCGASADDVRQTFWQLNITRPDPHL